MIEMERAAGDASHWSQQQYEIAVGGPERISLVVEEEGIVKGFFVARVLDREWEIENIVVIANGMAEAGHRLSSACGSGSHSPIASKPLTLFSWRFANRI